MGLTRKRQRELTRLKEHAEDVWGDQKEVLEHASQVVREASRQAANYAREEVSPKVRDTIDHNVKPAVASSVAATKTAVANTRGQISDNVVPAVSSAFGSALAAIEVAKHEVGKDPHVRDAVKSVTVAGEKVGAKLADASEKFSTAASKASSEATKAGSKAAKAGKKVAGKATKAGVKAGLVKQKSAGPGKYILIGVIVVAVAGIVYAAWQTLRADDDLWIDEDETPAQERDKPVDDTV
ncbi:MAG: hypothetical protein JWQ43_1548 [Glaciihabitans sp.]|nr:hypothetical protein [Glaciihabitans sp.]